jgi:hypothetical protein
MIRMTKIAPLFIVMFLYCASMEINAQSVSVNQQQVNINVPVIEKPVYIERYRTVYVDKPRVARKLNEPVLLLGYLWVYPEDLGNFKRVPADIITSINDKKPYGHDNWRIPTPDELAVLEANAEQIGLGDDIYLATDHCNGVLRLVCKEGEDNSCVKVGNTYWLRRNMGATSDYEAGSMVTLDEAIRYCPAGYRLPTAQEYEELRVHGLACFGECPQKANPQLFFPFSEKYDVRENRGGAFDGWNYHWYGVGEYWVAPDGDEPDGKKAKNKYIYFKFDISEIKVIDEPKIKSSYYEDSRALVRYVLDK